MTCTRGRRSATGKEGGSAGAESCDDKEDDDEILLIEGSDLCDLLHGL